MSISIEQIASVINAEVIGDSSVMISSPNKIEDAREGEITFLYTKSFEKFFPQTKASAIIVNPDFERTRDDIVYLVSESPQKALAILLDSFFKPEFPLQGIDKSASIAESASVGANSAIGANAVLFDGVTIGENVKIFPNVVLMQNVAVGDNTIIFPNVTVREECVIGKHVIIHPNSVIGSDGFGYQPKDDGTFHKVPQVGKVILEDNVEIGSNVSIDRAALGNTIIKKGAKLDNLVQIAHNVVIGENTCISAQTGVSGSTKIGKNCILAGQVGIVDHIEIADRVIVAAQSGISKTIENPGVYWGYPAKDMRTARRTEAHVRNLESYADRIKQLEKKLAELEDKVVR